MPLSFDDWLKRVDMAICGKLGIGLADLPDCCYADWYEDGITPSQAARLAVKAVSE